MGQPPFAKSCVRPARGAGRRLPRRLLTALALALAALSAGCGGKRTGSLPANMDLRDEPAVLAPGDSIEVKFYATPELNELQTIRPDGMIVMQLVGEVQAAGLTPGKLAEELRELYRPQLREPEPVVLVRTFGARRVFVIGEVLLPGAVAIPGGPMTVMEAVSQAGGPNPLTAEVRSVVVMRRTRAGTYRGFRVNLKEAIDGGTAEMRFLQPQDIVYVPRTRIVKIDQWVAQHINQIVPRLGLIYTRTSGNSTYGVNLTNGL